MGLWAGLGSLKVVDHHVQVFTSSETVVDIIHLFIRIQYAF
jgi:hypothetical protein